MPDMKESGELQPLNVLAVVEFAGADAGTFLQGQLSNDVLNLADGESQLTSFNTPKGRVMAILRLLRDAQRFFGVLPRELAAPLVERLGKYVLRSKVSMSVAAGLAAFGAPDAPHRIVVQTVARPPATGSSSRSLEDWKRANIAAGIPQIYAATSELFVAQMLNLDLVDGISFSKGCYTGQEIIARTQNLGRIKRRLLRFATTSDRALAPGATVGLDGFGNATVIEAATADAGGHELLAVVHLEPHAEDVNVATHPRIAAHELPLPYVLPQRST
jgi:tRNA-modifying protein YgfZ